MKIQLFIPEHKDKTSQFEDCQMVDAQKIDEVPNAVCTLLHLGTCRDFVDDPTFLQKAVSKLRYGGHLIVEGTDLIEVSYGLARDTIDVEDAKRLLFLGRHSCSTMNETRDILQQLKLTIVKNMLMQYKFSIRATRTK